MKRVLLILFVLFLALPARGQYTNEDIVYDNVSNPELLTQLLIDLFDNYAGTSVLFDPQTSAPTAAEGKVYYNDSSNALYVCTDGSTWTLIDLGSGTSLDGAYDLGNKIDVDGTVLELEVDDGSNNSALYIDHDEATNDNAAIVIENAADAAAAVSIQIDGTAGYDIQGTGDTWEISYVGKLTTSGGFEIEAGDCLWNDTYDLFVDTSKDLLLANDNFTIGFGGASGDDPDVGIKWNATNLLIEAATDNTGQILLGSTNAMDTVFYGSTNTNTVTMDVSAATVESNGWTWVIQDDDNLNFGDSDEFQIEYDEDGTDNLIIVAANASDAVQIGDGTTVTDFICQSSGDASAQFQFDGSGDTNNGSVLFGADDHGIDAYFYGATSGQYVLWDQSADTWSFGVDDQGVDVYFYGATASQYILWDQSLDTWYFGADGEGVDVAFRSDTTNDRVLWDESDEAMEFVGCQLHLDDDSPLQLGSTAGDVVLQFDGTDFLIDASTADEGLKIGDTTTGFDVTYYFETAGTITTDYDGDKLQFSDAIDLVFGTDGDFILESDTAKTLEMVPAAATDDYTVNLGVDQSGVDLKAFGATTGEYFMWDASADSVLVNSGNSLFTQTDAEANQFKIDATGTVAGYAVVIETTNGGVQVNADGSANGDISIDAQDDVTITADGMINTDGAFYPTSIVSETHVANDTMDTAADVGTLHLVGTDAVVITLPAVATGLKYKIMNIGADGTVEIHVDVNAADKFLGGCGFTALDDGDKITNTKATADIGDYVVIEYGTADGWYITEMVGTWADGG